VIALLDTPGQLAVADDVPVIGDDEEIRLPDEQVVDRGRDRDGSQDDQTMASFLTQGTGISE
jgi:hypothetical protein